MDIITRGIFCQTNSQKDVQFDTPSTFALLMERKEKENMWCEDSYQIFNAHRQQIGTLVLHAHPKFGRTLGWISNHNLLFIDPLLNGPFNDKY